MHTIVDRTFAGAGGRLPELDMPCFARARPAGRRPSRYLGAPLSDRVGAQYSLDTDYFNRMDALSYAFGHDDGQGGAT